MRKRFLLGISVLLCTATLLTLFASCKRQGEEEATSTLPTDDSATVETTTAVQTDENGYLLDDLPVTADVNRDMTIYAWQDQRGWEWCDESEYPTALLDQALYTRQKKIEERFGVTLTREYHLGSWDYREEYVANLAKRVLINDHAYDLVDQYLPAAGLATIQNLYTDLTQVNNLNFAQPWWPSRLVETASVGDKLYFATGDISPTFLINIHCMFANTQLYDNLNLSQYVEGRDVFEVVRDFDWTLETMLLLALNHVDTNEGYYGLTAENKVQADGFLYGGNFILIKTDENNLPALSPDLTSPKLSDWYDEVQKIFTDSYEGVSCDIGINTFKQKKSIFLASTLNNSKKFSEEGVSFTALPIPLRDGEQQQYCTTTNFWVSMFSIPADAKNKDESGMIMEALASEGYRGITDVVYYNLFKKRYSTASGADSAAMFDLVSDSVVFDGARMFADKLKMFGAFRNGVGGVGTDPNVITITSWPSIYASNVDVWKGNLISLIAAIG